MWSDAPPKLWVPQAPAIIRPADERLRKAVSFLVAPPIFRSAVAPANIVFTGTIASSAGGTVFTHTNHPISTAAVGRRILVGVDGYNATAPRTVTATIGGAAATKILSADGGSTVCPSAFFIQQVDAGTVATIVLTWSGAMTRNAIGVWAIYGLNSNTPVDSHFVVTTAYAAVFDFVLDTAAGGVVAATRNFGNQPVLRTFTWGAGLTENYDQQTIFGCNTGACGNTAAAVANQTFNCTATGAANTNNGTAMAVSLR